MSPAAHGIEADSSRDCQSRLPSIQGAGRSARNLAAMTVSGGDTLPLAP